MAGMLSVSQTIPEIMIYPHTITIKNPWIQSATILFATVIIVVTFRSGIAFSATTEKIGIITAHNLNLRPDPGTNSPPITVLNQGAEVKIIKHEGIWLKIEYKGQVGYIQNREHFVHIIPAKPTKESETGQAKSGDSDRKIERFEREAEDIDRQIEEREVTLEDITQKELGVLGSLNRLDISVDKTSRRISIGKSQLADLEKKIAKTTEHHKNLTKQIGINEDYAAKRLIALYKISWSGKMGLLASARSMHELLQRQRTIEQILAHDEEVRQQLIEDKTRLKDLLDRLNAQQIKKRALQTRIKKQYREISHQRTRRTALLEEIRNKRSLQIEAIESLKQAADALDQTIADLKVEIYPTEQLSNINMQPFSEYKGLLKMPVKGKIITAFGPYQHPKFKVTNFRSGIDIEADRGAKVQAVFAGHILYASWFKGYGNMIIINHGDNYYTVYAHLEAILKTSGDYVNAGDDIATVGDTGSMFGPKLYFEVRHRGKPMNPLEWIIKG
jgi:septal ring factor EnvC (AmiA/AmiB activator)